jgi:hypothetical protein
VTVKNSMNRGEANTRPGKFGDGVEPLEWCEQLARVFHVEPRTVVAHEEAARTLDFGRAELDAC